MENEVLVILMVAFGLIAIAMFILFYIYLKKYYNQKHLSEDYQKELESEHLEEEKYNKEEKEEKKEEISFEKENSNIKEIRETKKSDNVENEMEFVPIKKK